VGIPNRHQLLICNIGDSRVVLGKAADDSGRDSGRRLEGSNLSVDHKPDAPAERLRIESAGGVVGPSRSFNGIPVGPARVWDPSGRFGLACSRSFGDTCYSQPHGGGVIAEPEIFTHEVTALDRLLVLGSDGVWDRVGTQEAVDIASATLARGSRFAAEQIAKTAQARWLRDSPMQDDITAVVVDLRPLCKAA